jgi:hypothetical protein
MDQKTIVLYLHVKGMELDVIHVNPTKFAGNNIMMKLM